MYLVVWLFDNPEYDVNWLTDLPIKTSPGQKELVTRMGSLA